MKDKAFDKSFSDKLNQDRHLPFEEKEWEHLSKRLDESDSLKASYSKSQYAYWRWAIPILLLLLSFNGWMMYKMSKTQSENEVLIKEVKTVKTLLEKQNTIVPQPQIMQKTDTVFIYKTIYKTLPASFGQNNSIQQQTATPSVFQPILTDNSGINTGVNSTGVNKNITENPQNNLKTEDLTKNKESQNVVNHLVIKDLPKSVSYAFKPWLIFLNPQNSTILKPVSSIGKRLYVGWSYGLINYHTQWLNKDNIEISRNEQSFQTGLKAEFALNHHWRITASADYCPYDFKINWMDKRYNLPPLPQHFYPTKHTIKSIEGSQKIYLGSLGMKYLFEGTWIRPYLGLGYSAMQIPAYEATYTYADALNNLNYSKESLDKNINILNIAQFQGGLEFKLGKNMLLQADGFYYKDINKVQKLTICMDSEARFYLVFSNSRVPFSKDNRAILEAILQARQEI